MQYRTEQQNVSLRKPTKPRPKDMGVGVDELHHIAIDDPFVEVRFLKTFVQKQLYVMKNSSKNW